MSTQDIDSIFDLEKIKTTKDTIGKHISEKDYRNFYIYLQKIAAKYHFVCYKEYDGISVKINKDIVIRFRYGATHAALCWNHKSYTYLSFLLDMKKYPVISGSNIYWFYSKEVFRFSNLMSAKRWEKDEVGTEHINNLAKDLMMIFNQVLNDDKNITTVLCSHRFDTTSTLYQLPLEILYMILREINNVKCRSFIDMYNMFPYPYSIYDSDESYQYNYVDSDDDYYDDNPLNL